MILHSSYLNLINFYLVNIENSLQLFDLHQLTNLGDHATALVAINSPHSEVDHPGDVSLDRGPEAWIVAWDLGGNMILLWIHVRSNIYFSGRSSKYSDTCVSRRVLDIDRTVSKGKWI